MKIVLHTFPIFGVFLSGCAAVIMSIGEAETNIVNGSSTFTGISEILESKPALVEIDSLSISQLEMLHPKVDVLMTKTEYADGRVMYQPSKNTAVKFASYKYNGRIERKNAVGEIIALSGYTLFLAELFTIPYAISHQIKASNSVHTVDVWFDKKDRAIGYLWTEQNTESI